MAVQGNINGTSRHWLGTGSHLFINIIHRYIHLKSEFHIWTIRGSLISIHWLTDGFFDSTRWWELFTKDFCTCSLVTTDCWQLTTVPASRRRTSFKPSSFRSACDFSQPFCWGIKFQCAPFWFVSPLNYLPTLVLLPWHGNYITGDSRTIVYQ